MVAITQELNGILPWIEYDNFGYAADNQSVIKFNEKIYGQGLISSAKIPLNSFDLEWTTAQNIRLELFKKSWSASLNSKGANGWNNFRVIIAEQVIHSFALIKEYSESASNLLPDAMLTKIISDLEGKNSFAYNESIQMAAKLISICDQINIIKLQ